ncbi:MAG: CoA pyrophosphatase [Silicimonas sp.]|nr:CoA pyrophosphatase [Silicimonas sp.]NND18470.1 CoA pyrophosphatase [Silicimonas sp.]
MTPDLRRLLLAAINATGPPTSDYDLNPVSESRQRSSLRPASVLLPIVQRPGGARIFLTKRSSALEHHPGQIAFPGGKIDPDDDGAIGAALREAHEEIGLHPRQVELLGILPPHETVTGFTVTPVLALVDPAYVPVREVGEVDEVFEAPFSHVTTTTHYSVQSRRWRGEWRKYYTVAWGPYYIWGATARMLRALADRMADAPD